MGNVKWPCTHAVAKLPIGMHRDHVVVKRHWLEAVKVARGRLIEWCERVLVKNERHLGCMRMPPSTRIVSAFM